MKEYTYQDMLKMQDDALRRVREMQKLSQNVTTEENHEKVRIADEVKSISLPVEFDNHNNEQKHPNVPAQGGIIDYISGDSDVIIILSLIVLLGQDKADMPLILALAYILL